MAGEHEHLSDEQEQVMGRRLPAAASPVSRAHLRAAIRGEVKFGGRPTPDRQWSEINRSEKRMTIWCRHGSRHESAPRCEIGGLTSDRVYGLVGAGRFLDNPAGAVSLPCHDCQAIWEVSLPELERLARNRGPQLLRQLVDEVPGVSTAS